MSEREQVNTSEQVECEPTSSTSERAFRTQFSIGEEARTTDPRRKSLSVCVYVIHFISSSQVLHLFSFSSQPQPFLIISLHTLSLSGQAASHTHTHLQHIQESSSSFSQGHSFSFGGLSLSLPCFCSSLSPSSHRSLSVW